MTDLFKKLLRWFIRYFISFLVIVAILVVGNVFQRELQEFTSAVVTLTNLNSGKEYLERYVGTKAKEVSDRVKGLEKASSEALKARLDELDGEIQKKTSERRPLAVRTLALFTGSNGFAEDLKRDIEITLLEQERDYLSSLLSFIEDTIWRKSEDEKLERLRQIHVAAYAELQNNKREQARLKEESPIQSRVPWLDEYKRLLDVKNEHKDLLERSQRAWKSYQHQVEILKGKPIPKKLPPFDVQRNQIAVVLQPLNDRISELDKSYAKNYVAKIYEGAINVVPAAIAILLSIMLVPIAIKTVFYFVIAPLASRRPAICLLPEQSGTIEGEFNISDGGVERAKVSAVSLSITIDEAHELLVDPEYLPGAPVRAKKDTKWLLDCSYPLSSLASGMVALTRIRTTAPESVVVSATKDPLSEIGIISVPEGSAVVFQPHCLVATVQSRDRPIRITSHWRLASLHAWLTLQLRYLVFHGPAQLIVKGCRGIRIARAGNGQSINQAATIGFSANLAYSVTRCEPFAAYLMGKQELFDDNFAGGPGFYIYEETPHFGKKTGITGRGIEGFTDSILKIFGI